MSTTRGGILPVLGLEVSKVKWRYVTVCINIYHTASLTLTVELVNTHSKLCTVSKVISNRILATNVVTDLYRTALNLKTDLLELSLEEVVEEDSLRNLTKLWVTVVVV